MSQGLLVVCAAAAAALSVLLLLPRGPLLPAAGRTGPAGRISPAAHAGAAPCGPASRLQDAWLARGGNGEVEAHTRALRQLAALLESGRVPAEAWEMLGSTWSSGPRGEAREHRRRDDIVAAATAARTAHTLGRPSSQGIRRHLERTPYGHVWERVHWCLRLSEETGAPLAALLERLAEQIEAAYDFHRARQSALAGPRTTARLLAGLPAVGLLLAVLLGARPVDLLLGHPLAQLSFAAGLAFWFLNHAWTRRLLRRANGTAEPGRSAPPSISAAAARRAGARRDAGPGEPWRRR
ncbi:type II secretion system F family protein [Zhihengliuella sp.]|uniref:type II secretion system F family protein n=1 Tax=Zhihengliuella sp. TaxID=1954483 RepID=UPI002811EBA8|nr:type II secretion system F family protein [Zhihengliuella sp.]